MMTQHLSQSRLSSNSSVPKLPYLNADFRNIKKATFVVSSDRKTDGRLSK